MFARRFHRNPSIFHFIVLVCTLAGPNAFLKPQRIAMYGISCIGFIGCESDQNTDRTAHSAAFTDWMRNMQLLMIIQGNSLIVQMCSWNKLYFVVSIKRLRDINSPAALNPQNGLSCMMSCCLEKCRLLIRSSSRYHRMPPSTMPAMIHIHSALLHVLSFAKSTETMWNK